MAGQYIRLGSKIGSTYAEKPEEMTVLCDDFYTSNFHAFSNMGKSAGAATYGDNGYFNAIMGKEITAAMFSSKTTYSAMGSRPYNHEGVRIAYQQPDYGVDSTGKFVGIGATSIQDGLIPDSVMVPVDEFREPYKEVPFSWDYGLGLMALENKDDVSSYKDYAQLIAGGYTDLIDRTLLKPISCAQPTATDGARTVETSLQGIARCIGSFQEIGKTEDGVEITKDMVTPYGGVKSDFVDYRGTKESVFDGKLIDAAGGTFSLDYLDMLWMQCSPGWDDFASPNNKMYLMGHVLEAKTSAMMRAQQRLIDSVYIQRDFSGVKTVQGRPGGVLVNSWHNIPIIVDPNMAFDYEKLMPTGTKVGTPMLLDLKHIWMSTLSPVEVWNNTNPALTRKLQEVNVMNCRMETRIDKFIGHGRVINLADVTSLATP